MKTILAGASASVLLAIAASAAASEELTGEITVWSWNIAAQSLEGTVASFNDLYPNVQVSVEDLGNQQVFDRMVAGCSAGGTGLADVVTVENDEAEIFWQRFPDCFTDLAPLGYDEAAKANFPDWKRGELEVDGTAYAMPWDSGPVMMFYRRDLYEAAGVDAATIATWSDFIEAGQKVQAANPDVIMTQADLNGTAEFMIMIGAENGCATFSPEADAITINSPACAEALNVVKSLNDAGILSAADWGGKLQAVAAGTVATHMWGAWYEGSIRGSATDAQAGLWGMYRMPTISTDRRAANWGGSSLAIPSSSDNPEAAYAFVQNALLSADNQVGMLRDFGLVPTLGTALEDDYVDSENAFWGGQAIWRDVLATIPDVAPVRSTQYRGDAIPVLTDIQLRYLNGEFDTAEDALAEAARQISFATGLPVN